MVGTAGGERIGFELFGVEHRTAALARAVGPLVQAPQGVVDRPQLGGHFFEQGGVSGRRVVNWDGRLVGRRDGCIGHV